MRLNADMYSENDTDRRTTTKTVSHPQDITAEFCMCVCVYKLYYNIVTKPTILNSETLSNKTQRGKRRRSEGNLQTARSCSEHLLGVCLGLYTHSFLVVLHFVQRHRRATG